MANLWIGTLREQMTAQVWKMWVGMISVDVTFQEGSEHDALMRAFLASRNLKPLENTETPASFELNLPVDVICRLTPLPATSAGVAALLIDLFRHAGLNDDTPMHYHFHEVVK